MKTNNIIIGLGGTGGEVIRHLKKRVYLPFYPNIVPWIGQESDWKSVLPHFASDGIKFGEQKR